MSWCRFTSRKSSASSVECGEGASGEGGKGYAKLLVLVEEVVRQELM